MSAAPDGGVNELRAAVTSLCSDYGTPSVEQLLARGQRCLQHADALLDQRPSTAEHRHILTAAGWAGLLLACVYHDRGDTVAGERLRGEATGGCHGPRT